MNILEMAESDNFTTKKAKLGAAYMAAPGYEVDLCAEITRHCAEKPQKIDNLYLTKARPFAAAWAQTIWRAPEIIQIKSIKDGAKQLKARQRNWVMHPPSQESGLNGRAKLIASHLPPVKQKKLQFPEAVPRSQLGHWLMLDTDHILLTMAVSNPFPLGIAQFEENRQLPPNRAYLKLWEAFTLAGLYPKSTDFCVDLGASPGGWSWVLAQTGGQVLSIDKAPLAPKIAALPNVKWQQGSAFAVDPADLPQLDWVCSDIICYPERSYDLIQKWWVSGLCKNMICTIKFQRPEDHLWLDKIQQIPGGQCHHLHHNKHEVTWFGLRDRHFLPEIDGLV